MKTLVTGGTGFTGSHLVRRLLQRGDEVNVLDNQKGIFYDELNEKGARITIGSVTDKALLMELSKGCGTVYHLAAAFRRIDLPKSVYWDVNVNGTGYVCEACLANGVKRLVYCSTQGVHGGLKNPPGDENSPIQPEDEYQYTKYEGELRLLEYVKKGLDAIILRPMGIYGPGDPERFYMLYKRVNTGRFLMFGKGETLYHPVYITNLVDSFLAAENCKCPSGSIFLIGDEKYCTLNELVRAVASSLDKEVKITHLPFMPLYLISAICELICKPFGISPPLFRRRADWFRKHRAFSTEKAKKELGFTPRVDLETGLRETAEWYKDNGLIK